MVFQFISYSKLIEDLVESERKYADELKVVIDVNILRIILYNEM